MVKSNNKSFKITGDMIIGDVIRAFPLTMDILMQLGIHCAGCYIANFESIAEGVTRHGLDPKEVVKQLNKAIRLQNVRKRAPASKGGGKQRNTDLPCPGRAKS